MQRSNTVLFWSRRGLSFPLITVDWSVSTPEAYLYTVMLGLGLGLRPENVGLGLGLEGCGLGLGLGGCGLGPDQSLALLLAEKECESLKPLFRRLFCTPATSAPVERVFSTNIMRPHRAHMSNSLLETLMFLKCPV